MMTRSEQEVNEKLMKIARDGAALGRDAAIAYFQRRTGLTAETAATYVDRALATEQLS